MTEQDRWKRSAEVARSELTNALNLNAELTARALSAEGEVAALKARLEPFAQAAQNAAISGHPPFMFVGADQYEAARQALSQEIG